MIINLCQYINCSFAQLLLAWQTGGSMKKKLTTTLALIICFLGGCSLSASNSDMQDIVEETSGEQTDMAKVPEDLPLSNEKNNFEPPDLKKIHISKARLYCSREEYPALYEEVQALLSQRQRVLDSILGIDYDRQLNMDETITDEDGRIFYRFKEQGSLEDVRADLATVYTDDYINTDGAWYLTSLFREEQGKLYRTGGDGWADGLYNNWVLWETSDSNYYIIGYTAIGALDYGEMPILSIWTVSQTDEGLRICCEQDISFLQNIYVLPDEDN